MRKYFGTDGIRRIANTELSPELVYRVAKAGAYVLSKHTNHTPTILIGRDTRISGTLIESAMVAGFLSYGANVKMLGVMPTPGVAYLTKKLKADASVVISASHNTYEFNGVKYFSNKGMKIPDDIEEEIEEIMDSDKLTELNVEKTELLKTSEKSYFRTNFTNSQDEAEDDDEVGSYTVGEMMTKTITEASKTIDYISGIKILEQRAKIDGNKISEYFVDLDLTFLIDLNRKDDK